MNKLEEKILQDAALQQQNQQQQLTPLMINPNFVLNDQINTNHTCHQFMPNSTQPPSGPIYFNHQISTSITNNHHHVTSSTNASTINNNLNNLNFNEPPLSKSMPNSPIHITSPLKSNTNGQNVQVNFNHSPSNGSNPLLDADSPTPITLSPKPIKFNSYVD